MKCHISIFPFGNSTVILPLGITEIPSHLLGITEIPRCSRGGLLPLVSTLELLRNRLFSLCEVMEDSFKDESKGAVKRMISVRVRFYETLKKLKLAGSASTRQKKSCIGNRKTRKLEKTNDHSCLV